jgi:hypothetical protein
VSSSSCAACLCYFCAFYVGKASHNWARKNLTHPLN